MPVAAAPPNALEFARLRLGFEPDARQTEILECTAKRGILNCSRQWGKSTVSVARALQGFYGAGLSGAGGESGRTAERGVDAEGRSMAGPLGFPLRGDGDNKISLPFPNGWRIVGLPGMDGTVRGFSAVSLMLIDDASRVEDSMYKALRPMLAVSDGDLWLMTTPCGRQGFFYEAWEMGAGSGFGCMVRRRRVRGFRVRSSKANAGRWVPCHSGRSIWTSLWIATAVCSSAVWWERLSTTALSRWSSTDVFYEALRTARHVLPGTLFQTVVDLG